MITMVVLVLVVVVVCDCGAAQQHNVTQRIILHVMEYFWCIPFKPPSSLPTHDSHTFTWWKNWIAMRNKWLTGFGWSYESIRVSLCSTRLDGCVACRSREARERLMFIPTCQFHYKRNCCFALCSKGTTTTSTTSHHHPPSNKTQTHLHPSQDRRKWSQAHTA